jgi:hypothetical protein
MLLTLFSIEKAKPQEKPYKLSDGHGLYLLVKPNRSKLWRFRVRARETKPRPSWLCPGGIA